MRRFLSAAASAVLVYTLSISAASNPRPGKDWPQFRGIGAAGIAEGFSLPTEWDLGAGKNVLWKTDIPGIGHSSPVVWGDDIFISTSISANKDTSLKIGAYGDVRPVLDDSEHEWRVYAIDKRTGAVKWQHTALKAVPKIKRHTKATHANSTLATDGERVIAFFGSEGLYAYDMKGKLLWKKDLGVLDAGWFTTPDMQWEFGSSPVLHDGKVVILADVQKGSFLATFDAKTGKEVWKLTRNGDIPVPTPVVHEGLVYLTNAHGGPSPVYAIKETATGDITPPSPEVTSNDHIAWSIGRGGGYMCTPLAYRGLVYIATYNGVISAFDAKTGERKYQERLLKDASSAFTSSPVANDGKIYIAGEDGQVIVFKAGPVFERITTNDMKATVLASPAISDGRLLIRTANQLVAIGTK